MEVLLFWLIWIICFFFEYWGVEKLWLKCKMICYCWDIYLMFIWLLGWCWLKWMDIWIFLLIVCWVWRDIFLIWLFVERVLLIIMVSSLFVGLVIYYCFCWVRFIIMDGIWMLVSGIISGFIFGFVFIGRSGWSGW